jgi:hypothetical protein
MQAQILFIVVTPAITSADTRERGVKGRNQHKISRSDEFNHSQKAQCFCPKSAPDGIVLVASSLSARNRDMSLELSAENKGGNN